LTVKTALRNLWIFGSNPAVGYARNTRTDTKLLTPFGGFLDPPEHVIGGKLMI